MIKFLQVFPNFSIFFADLLKTDSKKYNFDENLVVIYNRVPKTGSTSFINLAYDLCKKNKFHVLHINITANMHTLSLPNQVNIFSIFIFLVPHSAANSINHVLSSFLALVLTFLLGANHHQTFGFTVYLFLKFSRFSISFP